jgi:hypothetical protein
VKLNTFTASITKIALEVRPIRMEISFHACGHNIFFLFLGVRICLVGLISGKNGFAIDLKRSKTEAFIVL